MLPVQKAPSLVVACQQCTQPWLYRYKNPPRTRPHGRRAHFKAKAQGPLAQGPEAEDMLALLRQVNSKLDRLEAKADEYHRQISTSQGDVFGAVVAAVPWYQRTKTHLICSDLQQLMEACGLAPSPQAVRLVREGLVKEGRGFEALRCVLRPRLLKALRQADMGEVDMEAIEQCCLEPLLGPEDFLEAADSGRQLLVRLEPNSRLHQFLRLLIEYSEATAKDLLSAQSGGASEHRFRLLATSRRHPKELTAEASMAVLMAVGGSFQDELEVDAEMGLRTAGQRSTALELEEAKISSKGAAAAVMQHRRNITVIAWLYAATGRPIPTFTARVTVGRSHRRQAEHVVWRMLGGRTKTVLDLPGGAGSAEVKWAVGTI